MSPETGRSSAQVLRGRGIGAYVGTLIGGGWFVYGLGWLTNPTRLPLGLLGLAAVISLLRGSHRLIASARSQPAPDTAARAGGRRAWTLFWVNFGVEIVLLNLAVNLLARYDLLAYLIPAISFVVGLHFLPMASFFAAPSYLGGGAAMIGLAAATALAMKSGAIPPHLLLAGEAIGNAIILWSMAAWGLRTAARPTVRSGRSG